MTTVGFAEQTLDRRQRRLGSHHAALALEALEHGGLLAADVRPGADPDVHPEREPGSEHVVAEPTLIGGGRDRRLEGLDRVGILRPDVDVTVAGADRVPGDDHPLDQGQWITLDQHPVGIGAAVTLVGVAGDVLHIARSVSDRRPLDAGGECRSPASTQARLGDFGDHLGGRHRERLAKPSEAACRLVLDRRPRIDHTDTPERDALLALQPGQLVDDAEPERMFTAGQCPGTHQFRHVVGVNRSVADAPRTGCHLDHRLEPQHAARPVAHDANLRERGEGGGGRIGSRRTRRGVDRNVDRDGFDLRRLWCRDRRRRSGGESVVEHTADRVGIEASVEPARRGGGRPQRAVAEAEHLGQLDRCPGVGQGASALHDSVGTARLARLGPADLDDRAARRSGAEVGVEGDDTVHLRDRQVENAGQHRHRCRIDVAQLVLDRVQGRHQPAGDVGEPLRDLVDSRRQSQILHDESLDAGFSERLTAHDADCRCGAAPGR